MIKDYKWGERVLVAAVLHRNREDGKKYVGKRFWERIVLDKPEEALFIKRTGLWDGTAYLEDVGEDWYPAVDKAFNFEKYHYGAYIVRKDCAFMEKVFLEDVERKKK